MPGDLFDSILVFENYPVSKLVGSRQWSLKVENLQMTEQANYPLTLLIAGAEEISIGFNYNSELLKKNYIQEICSHFKNVLMQIISDEKANVSEIELLTDPEEKQLLFEFNDTTVSYPRDKTIIDLFEEQVKKTPDNIAVVFEKEQLTYKELNERSNQLANYLTEKGITRETLVPICIERSIEMITGILGILKSGGVYVPVDPDYPEERIRYIVEDTGASIIISSKESSANLPSFADLEIISLDEDLPLISEQPSTNLSIDVKPNNLAYVIYTSGSTGKPKGALIEHYNVVRLFRTDSPIYDFNESDVWTMFHSFCFDFTVWEMYGALLFGGRLVIVPKHITKDASLFAELLLSEKVTVLNQTPSAFYALQDIVVDKIKSLPVRYVIFGGEALNPAKLQPWQKAFGECTLINMYGITETTVHVTYQKIDSQNILDDRSIIGKAIPTLGIYILDSDQNLVPVGVAGEIHVAGAGLARGYLNRPELTKEKFIPNPFNEDERIYRTGDLGRWLPDGNIEYLGRIDEQVKIRGYRIELGEIESVIQESKLVSQSVVLARETNEGSRRLVAYVVPEGDFDKEAIMNYLTRKLPEYMVPALWVELESLPLTPNGKIDKKALPDPDASELLSNEYASPRNELEEKLAAIWKDLLHVERVGIHDNFFELGGDSIITIQVVSRARRAGYELKPKDIFIHQTIGSISAAITERSAAAVTGEQGLLTGTSGLLPIQQWYFESAGESEYVSYYNQSVLLAIDKSVTPEILNRAVEQLTSHHDALRFNYYKNKDGQWEQEYGTGKGELITLSLKPTKKNTLVSLIKEEAEKYQQSLDIESGEIVRFVLMQTPKKETHNRILIVIHHLAVDGVSWRILLDDLEQLLTGLQTEGKPGLGNKSSSYRQWYEELAEYGKSKRFLSQIPYWEETESSYEPLRVDKAYTGKLKAKDIGHHTIRLDFKQTQLLLREVPRVYHTEINDMLLCALAMTLCEWGNKEKITIGLEGHGRESITQGTDISRTVGWFTSLYPVLLEVNSGKDISDAIKSVKEQLRRVPDKGLGYGVLKYINKDEKLSNKDCWDIVFNYLGQLDNVVSSGKWLSGAGESKGSSSSEEHGADYHTFCKRNGTGR